MDRTLLKIFSAEQAEHAHRIRTLTDLLGSVKPDGRAAAVDELLRRAHTLKGAARAVGLEPTEAIVHRMEDVFTRWRSQTEAPAEAARSVIQRAVDAVEDVLAWALGTRSQPDVSSTLQELEAVEPDRPTAAGARQQTVLAPPVEPDTAPELVSVNTALLDDVVRSASHLIHATFADNVASSRMEQHAERVEQALNEYTRLRRSCAPYVRAYAQVAEFGPVAECLHYADRQLRQVLSEARTAASAQQQSRRAIRVRASEVYENACRARLTPAQTVFGALGAMVRDLAGQESKQIEFRPEGMSVQADREVLQALKDPVIHILRNAVSHGIEPPAERLAAGKPAAGMIRFRIQSRGDWLRIEIEDDGRGLNLQALARQAVESGLMTEAAAAAASPALLANLIFRSGVSTSDTVTRLSGRGIGLSAVSQAVGALQGDVSVRDRPGEGVTLELSLPMSISSQQVLLVREGEHVFALPIALIERLSRFRPADVRVVNGKEAVVLDGMAVPLVRFAELLGIERNIEEPETTTAQGGPIYQAAILMSGGERVALVVDALLDEREALVKPTGLPRRLAGWSAGAIPLEDGSVAVLISVARLMKKFRETGVDQRSSFQLEPEEQRRCRILVVDDSITTRSMERSLLEAHGYDVTLAVDGSEAWNVLRTSLPDLVISDVSMPVMDGFQLLERIKSDPATSRLPVILVTSLESREEQERGLSLGADAYIVKRKFDQRELLKIVRQIL